MSRETFGAGDSYVVYDVLPSDLAKRAFAEIKAQTNWQEMSHKGGVAPRLISVQGRRYQGHYLNDANKSPVDYFPLYRHPTDAMIECIEFSPAVAEIAEHVSSVLCQTVNHALVQYYRDGNDLITEHSDKTIDLVEGTLIANVSLGYTRTMTLRTKGKADPVGGISRTRESIPLPDNSLFVMGPKTNQKWLHGIRPDKTLHGLGGASERISLTFRVIGTYIAPKTKHIFGVGAKRGDDGSSSNDIQFQSLEGETYIASTVTDSEKAMSELFQSFSTENKSDNLSRAQIYGQGSNVLT